MPWTVLLVLSLYRRVELWDPKSQIELSALLDRLRDDGPDGVLRHGFYIVENGVDWENLSQSCRINFWTGIMEDYIFLSLEVHPSRTIVVQDAFKGMGPV